MHPMPITVAVTATLGFFANADKSASASEYRTPPPEIPHRNINETCELIKECLLRFSREFENMTSDEIVLHREKKYLEIGKKFLEN